MSLWKSKIIRRSGIWSAIALAVGLGVYATGWAQTSPADHSAHVHPATAPSGAPLSDQVTELRAKVSTLEAALQQKYPVMAADPAKPAMSGMPATAPDSGTGGMAMDGMDKMKGMEMGMPEKGGMPGQKGGMPSMMHNMAAMMQEMGNMMQNMEGMDAMGGKDMTKMPPIGPMSGKGSMASMKQGGHEGHGAHETDGMGPGKMKMGPMMGMPSMMGMPPAADMADSAALPGFPGASHLYHIGADDFFLNHDEHITLTTEQRAALGQAKENALMEKATTERKIGQGEQELWQLTASDQPDVAKIEAKLREIEQLRGNERLSFIRAVGEAGKVLTDQQRKSLLGMQPPQSPPASADPNAGHVHPPTP